MNTRIITATLLIAGLAASAGAQTWPGNEGDLILGVRDPSVSQDLLVDLGSASNYFSGTGAVLSTLSSGNTYSWNLAADLNTAFGTAWKTAGNVSFSIIGGDSGGDTAAPANTIWAVAPSGVALLRSTGSNQSGLIGNIDINNTPLQGQTAASSLGNDLLISNTDPDSYSVNILKGGGAQYQYTYWGTSVIESDVASGKSLALYELKPGSGAGTILGDFTLNSSGVLSFSLVAIPEPSTYAMILGVFALGFVMLRRRHQVTA